MGVAWAGLGEDASRFKEDTRSPMSALDSSIGDVPGSTREDGCHVTVSVTRTPWVPATRQR